MSERIPVHKITLWKRLQPRLNGLNQETVEEYADAMTAGSVFPPIDVYRLPDETVVLVDGWHRIRAAQILQIPDIECNVTEGTEQEAIDFALFQANRKNGQRLSSADKRQIVAIAITDPRFESMSTRELAKIINVSHATIANERKKKNALRNQKTEYNKGTPPQIAESDMEAEKKKYTKILTERLGRDAGALRDRIEYVSREGSDTLILELEKLIEALR